MHDAELDSNGFSPLHHHELLVLSSLSDESRHRSDEDVLKDTGADMTSVNSNELGLLQARRQCSTRVKYVDNHGGVMAHSLVAKSPTPEAETQSLCRTTPMKTMRSDGSDGSTTVIVVASSCASVFLPLGVGIVISNNVQKKPAPL